MARRSRARWSGRWLAGCVLAALASGAPAAPTGDAPPPGLLGVQSGAGWPQLLRDCKPWVPRGLSFFGRLVPRSRDADESTAAARDRFDAEALPLARAIGADLVRLQIGQPFLDPQSPQFDPAYLGEVRDAVAAARRGGFSVILSLQWEGRTGVKPVEMLPKASALRAWGAVAPAFAGDLGVAFELFNEPASPPDPGPGVWEAWRAGHQALVDQLRRAGVRNLLIADGLRGAQRLDGAPPLADPLGQLAYAVHPYFGQEPNTPEGWDQRFGRFAATHPVIATEWGHAARQCERGGPEAVEGLLAYLAERRIGLVAYGADERHSRLAQPVAGGAGAGGPTWSSYRGRPCTGAAAGPGEMIHAWFERQAREAEKAAPVDAAACERPALRR